MIITLDMVPEAEREVREEAARRGETVEEMTQQALMRTLLEGLKNRPVPKSLDELKPRRVPPPGKTVMDMLIGQWPGDETDEELQAALKAMG